MRCLVKHHLERVKILNTFVRARNENVAARRRDTDRVRIAVRSFYDIDTNRQSVERLLVHLFEPLDERAFVLSEEPRYVVDPESIHRVLSGPSAGLIHSRGGSTNLASAIDERLVLGARRPSFTQARQVGAEQQLLALFPAAHGDIVGVVLDGIIPTRLFFGRELAEARFLGGTVKQGLLGACRGPRRGNQRIVQVREEIAMERKSRSGCDERLRWGSWLSVALQSS